MATKIGRLGINIAQQRQTERVNIGLDTIGPPRRLWSATTSLADLSFVRASECVFATNTKKIKYPLRTATHRGSPYYRRNYDSAFKPHKQIILSSGNQLTIPV